VPRSNTIDYLKDIVTTWRVKRDIEARNTNDRTNAASLRKFVEIQNAQTRLLIAEFGTNDPDFYTALFELAMNAQTMTTKGAKLFVDGQDRTND
jgi:hypothetical protein